MRFARDAQSSDRKAGPLSVVMSSGTPKRLIQLERRASAQAADDASCIGVASGHLVDLSIMVRRNLASPEGGSGPTTSTWMCPNLRFGCGKSPTPDSVCLVILLV